MREIKITQLNNVTTITIVVETDRYNIEYCYHSLKDIYAEWEDYEPKEPLIKDEKIRKAARAFGYKNYIYTERKEMFFLNPFTEDKCKYIGFHGKLENCENGKLYRTDELCGEEEDA